MKIKILKNVTARIDGKSVPCKVGEILETNAEDGENLVNGGYAEATRAAVKVKEPPQPRPLTNKSMKGK